ncbi:transglutaminase-like cysteine peptidase [Thiohalobacter sp. IOR34]|uniref:transglutaminase-like cysteine peptidase n=1 Tax=Thiohalobacter sp. IOR34 TaxID=3057176 RepID=UPI0025B023E9|nr:transglutaminase-like cysteine peptidase [Thiohalobacter sp. IOR34]WJW76161.1 transglutaminase-like cysteine peptidase [Thiohalobacter sp. IOR34]
MRRATYPRLGLCLALCLLPLLAAGATPALFGYREIGQRNVQPFRQWLDVLERHITQDLPEADCGEQRLNRCHLRAWYRFLDSLRGLPLREQLKRVNDYANRKPYVLDIDNYGLADYWAIPREFLYNNGDCEDYAITKLFSLRWLGFDAEAMRIVVLQDTNLQVPHAVLAVYLADDILILDNQIRQVIPHRQIVHYAPVYSINESHWWIHVPSS